MLDDLAETPIEQGLAAEVVDSQNTGTFQFVDNTLHRRYVDVGVAPKAHVFDTAEQAVDIAVPGDDKVCDQRAIIGFHQSSPRNPGATPGLSAPRQVEFMLPGRAGPPSHVEARMPSPERSPASRRAAKSRSAASRILSCSFVHPLLERRRSSTLSRARSHVHTRRCSSGDLRTHRKCAQGTSDDRKGVVDRGAVAPAAGIRTTRADDGQFRWQQQRPHTREPLSPLAR